MPSIVWNRDPQEAYENPYEYGAQEQFLREALALLADLNVRLSDYTLQYHRDEKTLAKATWMLSIDLIDALTECAHLLKLKRHRVAARLFRDCVETIDFLKVLHSGTPASTDVLAKWYSNTSPTHRESRHYIKQTKGAAVHDQRNLFYQQLSKFTHRSYRALLDSYSLGRNDMLVHDSYSMGLLASPQAIASYLAVLAALIFEAVNSLGETQILSLDNLNLAIQSSFEVDIVPRRFEVLWRNVG